jgi:uncharacterized phage protein gp47/JayE
MAVAGRLVPVPNLDDRDWLAIKTEMLAYIRDHLGEWTDLNPSDPGVTLVEAFAQQIEQLGVRANAILDKHLREYLNMIGVTLTPPAAAQVWCYFKAASKPSSDVLIPAGFEVGTVPVGDETPIVFTTDEDMVLEAALIKRCLAEHSGAFTDYSIEANPPGTPFNPFSAVAAGDALYVAYARDCYWRRLTVTIDAGAVDVTGVWEFWEDDPEATPGWKTLSVDDGTEAFAHSGTVAFDVPAFWAPTTIEGYEGTWLRFRVTALGAGPSFATIRLLALDDVYVRGLCSNAVVIPEETLGSSDGTPDQAFYFSQVPALDATVLVDEGVGFEAWTEVADLPTSSATDRHFTLNRGTGEVVFGDGRHGKVPAIGSGNVKVMPYRYGGGAAGNVGAGTLTKLRQTHAWLSAVSNLVGAQGGSDEETVDEAIERGPAEVLRTRDRGVVDVDFETLVLEGVPGVSRVRTFPLFDPANPSVPKAGVLTVVVLPVGGSAMTATLRDAVRSYLDARRLLTAQLHVVDVGRVTVDVDVRVAKTSDASRPVVEALIRAALLEFYHPEHGGDVDAAVAYAKDSAATRGTGWEYGHNVFRFELGELLERVPGVDHVEDVVSPAATVTIENYQLPQVGTITVEVL